MTQQDGLATLRLSREHGNAINDRLVGDLTQACEQAEGDRRIRGVLLAAEGKLFCPGLDLQELIELDRPEMEPFLERFNRCVTTLYALSKPVVAAIHGHAVAGGCVLALTADWRVLADSALIGLNEVRVGVPFPFGVAMLLRETVPAFRLEEVALFGRNYRGQDAVAAGLAHEVRPAAGFEAHCVERLRELADKDATAIAVTKRYLRSLALERMRSVGPEQTSDFLDAWFSSSTRERLRRVVEDLRAS